LSRAAERGDKGVVKLLLENRAQPDFEDENKCTPLSRAIEGGNTAVVEILLAQGVKVDYDYIPHRHYRRQRKISLGDYISLPSLRREFFHLEPIPPRTPLSRAAEKGDKAVVELLLKSGARPDLKDPEGHTPLSRATLKNKADVVQLLNQYLSSSVVPRKRPWGSEL